MQASQEQNKPTRRGRSMRQPYILPTDPRSPTAVGLRLKAMRCGLGQSQGIMGRAIGSTTVGQLWHRYEVGNIPTLVALRRIVDEFGFPMSWILDGDAKELTHEQCGTIAIGYTRMDDHWRPHNSRADIESP